MLYPALSELESRTKSRYALVILTAKRARQLSEKAEKNEIYLAEKPVKLALLDIANGRVRVKEPGFPEETEE